MADRARYLVLCAGIGYRWHDYLGIRKHEIPIDGETIISRTCRQLVERGCEVVVVAPDLPAYLQPDTRLYTPSGYRDTNVQVDKFLSSYPIWNRNGPTVFLWGDTWFSNHAIDLITGHQGGDDWHVWLRPGPSKFTGRGHGEMFAHRFEVHMHQAEVNACNRIIDLHRRDLIPWPNTGGWALYRAMLGLPDGEVHGWNHDGSNVTVVDDWTDDFDQPLDYPNWYGRWAGHRYPLRVRFTLDVLDLVKGEWPESDQHPVVDVLVGGNLTIPRQYLWAAVTHAQEWHQGVVPYSHPIPSGSGWSPQPIHTGPRGHSLITVTPIDNKINEFVRFNGPAFEWPR